MRVQESGLRPRVQGSRLRVQMNLAESLELVPGEAKVPVRVVPVADQINAVNTACL